MSNDQIEDRTIALAGVFNACSQVQGLAREGTFNEADFEASLSSILILDAASSASVFGGLDCIRTGLKAITDGILVSPSAQSTEVLRYVMSILELQKKLFKDSARVNQFAARVEGLSAFSHEQMPDQCAQIYQEYVSSLTPKIIVNGEEEHLQQNGVPTKIRTLLLAAIRAAVLWEQKGGGRLTLLFQRTRMQNAARALLARGLH